MVFTVCQNRYIYVLQYSWKVFYSNYLFKCVCFWWIPLKVLRLYFIAMFSLFGLLPSTYPKCRQFRLLVGKFIPVLFYAELYGIFLTTPWIRLMLSLSLSDQPSNIWVWFGRTPGLRNLLTFVSPATRRTVLMLNNICMEVLKHQIYQKKGGHGRTGKQQSWEVPMHSVVWSILAVQEWYWVCRRGSYGAHGYPILSYVSAAWYIHTCRLAFLSCFCTVHRGELPQMQKLYGLFLKPWIK